MKNRLLPLLACTAIALIASQNADAQGMAVNSTGATANSTAILDVSSTTQGMLIPRMTAAQRTAISSPAIGLLVYQTDGTTGFYFYNGAWTSLNAAGGSAGGDLSGTYPNPTISSSAATGNNIVTALGSATTGTIPAARLGSASGSANSFLNGTGAFSAPLSLTTTGSSGAATFSSGTLNIPQYTGNVGTVTTVTANALSPIFTSSVANPTSTPAISFSLSSVAAHKFLGNNTGGAATPSYTTVGPSDLTVTSGTASSATFYRGDGAWATPSGGFLFSALHSPGSSSTVNAFTQAVAALSGASSFSGGTTSQNIDVVAAAFVLDAMYVSPIISATYISGPVNVYTGTVYKNGSATSMSVTVTTGTTNPNGTVLATVSDVSHTVSLAAGDIVSVLWSQTESINGELANMRVSFHGH